MMSYTKSPWRIDRQSEKNSFLILGGPTSKVIASCPKAFYYDSDSSRKNVHLISAAPELYEACKEVIRSVGQGMPSEGVSIYKKCRLAVSKAEGEDA